MPSIHKETGLFRYGFSTFRRICRNGLRSTAGRVISDCAYYSRAMNNSYQAYLDRHGEPDNVSIGDLESSCNVVLVADGWSEQQIVQTVEHVQQQSWSANVYIQRNAADLDLSGIGTCRFSLWITLPCITSYWFCHALLDFSTGDEVALVADHDLLLAGQRHHPYFKPGINPALFSDQNYNSFVLFRNSELGEIDFSLSSDVTRCLLRCASAVGHYSEVTYHLISSGGVDAVNVRASPQLPDTFVSIIIPTRDRLDILQECIESICRFTEGIEYELIIVDNGSIESETIDWLEKFSHLEKNIVIRIDEPFNWSRLNNIGAARAKGDVFVFLNNDIEVRSKDWLTTLVRAALDDKVGCVGPMLNYPDGRIQHAGIVVGFGGAADHVYSGFLAQNCYPSAFTSPTINRNVVGITGACQVVRRDLFNQVGCFDESFSIAGDLKLCIDVMKLGYLNFYLADVRLVHHESATRKSGLPEEEAMRVKCLIAEEFPDGDPFFNKNLSLKSLYPLPD